MLNPNEPEPAERSQSVFLRISEVTEGSKDPVGTTLLEIDPDGYIPREIGLAKDRTAVYVTRPRRVRPLDRLTHRTCSARDDRLRRAVGATRSGDQP